MQIFKTNNTSFVLTLFMFWTLPSVGFGQDITNSSIWFHERARINDPVMRLHANLPTGSQNTAEGGVRTYYDGGTGTTYSSFRSSATNRVARALYIEMYQLPALRARMHPNGTAVRRNQGLGFDRALHRQEYDEFKYFLRASVENLESDLNAIKKGFNATESEFYANQAKLEMAARERVFSALPAEQLESKLVASANRSMNTISVSGTSFAYKPFHVKAGATLRDWAKLAKGKKAIFVAPAIIAASAVAAKADEKKATHMSFDPAVLAPGDSGR